MVLFGEYRNRVDEQGRIVVPAKIRDLLRPEADSPVYVTRGIEQCLYIFSRDVWESQSERLKSLPFTKGDPRAFTRLFFSGAAQSKVDRQGRILVPAHLLQYAGIRGSTVLVGVGTRVEIWDEARWDEYFTRSLPTFGELAEKLIDL